MLKNNFRLNASYRVAIYGRQSTDSQNPRSPDQQIDTINNLIRTMGLPWEVVAVYRDDGISGRFTRKRPGYQKMLRDLASGALKVQLLLVDTFERLSRAEDSSEIRRNLERSSVLVLTADSRFQDPTSVAGRALSMVEAYRATADGEIKAHNVGRGKRDAARLGKWPGGPAPLGFRLRYVMVVRRGVEEIDYRVLEPDPERAWIIIRIFSLAAERGWGCSRIAKELNSNPDVPQELKPFLESTVNYILKNRLYIGEMVWGKNCTGIKNDVRVVQANSEEDWEVNSGFCEAIVSKDVWDQVYQDRQVRKRKRKTTNADENEIIGLCPSGVALKYPLSSLVDCEVCGRTMTISSCSPYTTDSGEKRNYASYACPASHSGACTNKCRVPEPWIRETVMNLIRRRLFLVDDSKLECQDEGCIDTSSETDTSTVCAPDKLKIMQSRELLSFVEAVRQRLEACQPNQQIHLASLESERVSLENQCRGWRMTLSNPDLANGIRLDIESDYSLAKARINAIECSLVEESALCSSVDDLVNPERVLKRLEKLGKLLEGDNASAINLALSEHIESIRCLSDGRVRIRLCILGALANPHDIERIVDLLPATNETSMSPPNSDPRRRRTRRNVGAALEEFEDLDRANDAAVDINRFAGLGDEWFTIEEFQIVRRQSWAQRMARNVAEYRLTTRATMAKTCEHFDRTIPTIRSALKIAKDEFGIDAMGKSLSVSTWATWSRVNAEKVKSFLANPGATKLSAAKHFGQSWSRIESALAIAEAVDRGATESTVVG